MKLFTLLLIIGSLNIFADAGSDTNGSSGGSNEEYIKREKDRTTGIDGIRSSEDGIRGPLARVYPAGEVLPAGERGNNGPKGKDGGLYHPELLGKDGGPAIYSLDHEANQYLSYKDKPLYYYRTKISIKPEVVLHIKFKEFNKIYKRVKKKEFTYQQAMAFKLKDDAEMLYAVLGEKYDEIKKAFQGDIDNFIKFMRTDDLVAQSGTSKFPEYTTDLYELKNSIRVVVEKSATYANSGVSSFASVSFAMNEAMEVEVHGLTYTKPTADKAIEFFEVKQVEASFVHGEVFKYRENVILDPSDINIYRDIADFTMKKSGVEKFKKEMRGKRQNAIKSAAFTFISADGTKQGSFGLPIPENFPGGRFVRGCYSFNKLLK